jgi:hypothetical protein
MDGNLLEERTAGPKSEEVITLEADLRSNNIFCGGR